MEDIDLVEIEDLVKKLDGVYNTRLNHVTGKIEVNYDPGKLTLDKIRERILNK